MTPALCSTRAIKLLAIDREHTHHRVLWIVTAPERAVTYFSIVHGPVTPPSSHQARRDLTPVAGTGFVPAVLS